MRPAAMPISTAPCGPISKLHTDPTATPPASVEFCTCTMSSLCSWLTMADKTNVVTAGVFIVCIDLNMRKHACGQR